MIFDFHAALQLLEEAVTHYERSAPTVSRWADRLFVALAGEPWEDVTLEEIRVLQQLTENGQWMPPHVAANTIYKLKARLGQDVTGEAGY